MGDEVTITYEVLFEFLRREKNREDIQELQETFYEEVQQYLASKEALLNAAKTLGEKQNLANQMGNARKIVKELYERREKKIIHLALYQAKVGSGVFDIKNLLKAEKELLEKLASILLEYKKNSVKYIADEMHQPNEPKVSGSNVEKTKKKNTVEDNSPSNATVAQKETDNNTKAGGTTGVSSDEPADPQADTEGNESTDSTEPLSAQVSITIKKDIPRFVGPNLNIIGPFKSGEAVTLDSAVASLLLDKGQAESTQ